MRVFAFFKSLRQSAKVLYPLRPFPRLGQDLSRECPREISNSLKPTPLSLLPEAGTFGRGRGVQCAPSLVSSNASSLRGHLPLADCLEIARFVPGALLVSR